MNSIAAAPSTSIYSPLTAVELSEIEALEPGAVELLLSLSSGSTDRFSVGDVTTVNNSSLLPLPSKGKAFSRKCTVIEAKDTAPASKRSASILREYVADVKKGSTTSDAPKSSVRSLRRRYTSKDTSIAVAPDASAPTTLFSHDDEDQGINPTHNVIRRDIIEVFVARQKKNDHVSSASKAIKARRTRYAGVIGLRCRFCKHLPEGSRAPLSTVYPESLQGMYRACTVRFQKKHLKSCEHIPRAIRKELKKKANIKNRGSKRYWVESAMRLGLKDSEDSKGILFCPEIKS